MRTNFKAKLQQRLLIGAFASVVLYQSVGAAGQVSLSLTASTHVAETPEQNAGPMAADRSKLFECPTKGVIVSTPPLAEPAQHPVTLFWNPSTSAKNPKYQAVGYCLYRRSYQPKQPSIPKKISDCHDCERINWTPVAGTGCVDNQVPDGKTYVYVVAFLGELENGDAETSDRSNEAIPQKKPSPTYPLCQPKQRLPN